MEFTFMLAPLEDSTDNAFRELCFRHGADLTFSEMTRITGLTRHNKSTEKKIEILNDVPTQIQLAVQNEDKLKQFLKEFSPTKGFAGFNLNLGCPSPDLVKQGLGCALIKRVSKVRRLINIIKESGYPCSVKMRLGLNHFEKERKVYLNLIRDTDADFYVVHARHGDEHYEIEADNSAYPECVGTGKNIIANGDIVSKAKVDMFKSMGLKGVMIGRAAVRNPAIFELIKGNKETSIELIKKEYLQLSEKYGQSYKYQKNVLKRLGSSIVNSQKDVVMG
ncbi:MAG: tRNA-dihydrouridine synthase family protein [archaeon]